MKSRTNHQDSISVFLQGIKQKTNPRQSIMSVQQTPVSILTQLDRASAGSLDLHDLHGAVADVSMTQLTRFVEQLAEAGLVAVDPLADKIELTDTGRSVAKLSHVMSQTNQ